MDLAFQYIIKNDGIDKEEFYRYRAHVSQYIDINLEIFVVKYFYRVDGSCKTLTW